MAKKAGHKRKKVEKAKTQLKRSQTGPGNHLPKGTNVTRTDFKVGKIVIPKQTDRAEDGGPVTKKKLGLKDLVSKLTHFSTVVRLESLEGLRELVTGLCGGNLVNQNLSLLVSKLTPLTSDREGKVRRSAFAILQAILVKVEERKLEPLFPVLSAHVSCCLTHIDPAIQQDGLKLIDALVSSMPSFIAQNFQRILPDCLQQISSTLSSESNKVGVSALVSDNISSLQWRIDVLSRVDKMLDSINNHISCQSNSAGVSSHQAVVFREKLHLSLYGCPTKHLNLTELANKSGEDPMLSIIDLIIPLILDSWVEGTSKEKREMRTGFLTNDVYPLLQHISSILDKLVSYSTLVGDVDHPDSIISHMKTRYSRDLHSRIFSHVPYSTSMGKCNLQNMLLASVALSLAQELDADMLTKILRILGAQKSLTGERLKVLKKLFDKCIAGESRLAGIELMLEMYQGLPADSAQRTSCNQLLSALAETEGSLVSWLESLPTLLLSVPTSSNSQALELLQIMLKFAQSKNVQFGSSFKNSLPSLQEWTKGLEKDNRIACEKLIHCIEHNVLH